MSEAHIPIREHTTPRYDADCTYPACGLRIMTRGQIRFTVSADRRVHAFQSLMEHVRLWHPGPDRCSNADCGHFATEPRTSIAVPGEARVCGDHSRLRLKDGRVSPRIFCEDAACPSERDAVVFAWDGARSAMLCASCAGRYPDGRAALERMNVKGLTALV